MVPGETSRRDRGGLRESDPSVSRCALQASALFCRAFKAPAGRRGRTCWPEFPSWKPPTPDDRNRMTTPCVRGSSLKDAMHPPGEPSDTKVANSTTIGIFAVTILAVSAKALSGGGAISAEGFVDPATGIAFSPSEGKLGLMGVGVRVKKLGPVAVKVYSVGFYRHLGCLKAVDAKADAEGFYGECRRGQERPISSFARAPTRWPTLASVAGARQGVTQFGTLLATRSVRTAFARARRSRCAGPRAAPRSRSTCEANERASSRTRACRRASSRCSSEAGVSRPRCAKASPRAIRKSP